MRIVAVLAVSLAAMGCSDSLSETAWVQVDPGDPHCPDRVTFSGGRYSYYNACHADQPDGLVETGRYTFSGGSLVFSERKMHALPHLTGTYPGDMSFWGTPIRQDQLVLQFGPSVERRFSPVAAR